MANVDDLAYSQRSAWRWYLTHDLSTAYISKSSNVFGEKTANTIDFMAWNIHMTRGYAIAERGVLYGHSWYIRGSMLVKRYTINVERELLLAIMYFSLSNMDGAQSTVHSCHCPFVLTDDFKRQLLDIAVPTLNRIVHPIANLLPKFDAKVFQETGAYIASDLFPSRKGENSRRALECLTSLMHREPRFHVLVPPEKWATKSLFLNIAKLCRDGSYSFRYESDATFCPCHQDDADEPPGSVRSELADFPC